MSTMSPPSLALALTPAAPTVWVWPANANCWTMYYDYGSSRWLLDGGQGLVVYGMSGPFRCQGPNTFDTVLTDQTGGLAPASITVWPLSAQACECPFDLWPPGLTLRLRLSQPRIRPDLSPESLTLPLLLAQPRIRPDLSPGRLTMPLVLAQPLVGSDLPPSSLTLALVLPAPALAVGQNLPPGPLTLALTLAAPSVSQAASGVPCSGTGTYATLHGTFSAGTGGLAGLDGVVVTLPSTATGIWQGAYPVGHCATGVVEVTCSADVWKFTNEDLFQGMSPSFSQSYSPSFIIIWHLVVPGGSCGMGTVTFTLTL